MCRFSFVFFILTMIFYFGNAHAEEAPLTLDKTLQRVYNENPSILAARYNLKATEELYPQATSGWKPRLDAEANLTSTRIESGNFNQGDGATTKGASISLEQPLFRGFRTVAETEAAKNRINADTAAVQRAEQSAFLESVEAYMNVIRDRMLLQLQRKNVDLLQRERESVQARFDAGDVTQTDVKQTEARYSSAVADDAIAESMLQESEAEFERVVGFFPVPVLVMPVVNFNFAPAIDGLIAQASAENPALSSSRFVEAAARNDIRTAKSNFYPQVTAFASHLKEYDPQPGIVDESETSTIGLRARINLYEGGNNLSRIREAKQRANLRYVETLKLEKGVTSDLKGYWHRLRAYDAEIEARRLEVAAAEYSRDGVREEARLGDRTVLDTLDAEKDVLEAEEALVQARRDKVITAYRLAAALGMLVPEKMGFGPAEPLKTDLAEAK